MQQPPFTPMVKRLVIANVAVWLLFQLLFGRLFDWNIVGNFGLVPYSVLMEFKLWQIFSYMFLHGGVLHLPFNMLMLWFIGSELELKWGSRFFLTYYLVCGVGAALIYLAVYTIFFMVGFRLEMAFVPVIGASGAVFGLLLAYGILFGERILYFMLLFPMKAKIFVLIIGLFELVMVLGGGQSGVANLAHLGGLISGFLFLWGSARWSSDQRKKRRKRNGPKLHLVIDNDQPDDDSKKYWN